MLQGRAANTSAYTVRGVVPQDAFASALSERPNDILSIIFGVSNFPSSVRPISCVHLPTHPDHAVCTRGEIAPGLVLETPARQLPRTPVSTGCRCSQCIPATIKSPYSLPALGVVQGTEPFSGENTRSLLVLVSSSMMGGNVMTKPAHRRKSIDVTSPCLVAVSTANPLAV